ncbi:MAG: hypothetical protein ACREBH_00600 [Candidatus Micrarchaeaceae archaeon]
MRKMILLLLAAMAVVISSVGALSITGMNSNAWGFGRMQIGRNNAYQPSNTPYMSNSMRSRFGNGGPQGQQLNYSVASAQCNTTFMDSAAPVASSFLDVNLNVSQVNSANAKLQSDFSSNAPYATLQGDLISFHGAVLVLVGEAYGPLEGLNQTQLASLKSDLNPSYSSYKSCIGSNSISTNGNFRTGYYNMRSVMHYR